MKICTTCNKEKDFNCFGKHKHGKNGLRGQCKDCELDYRTRTRDIKNKKTKLRYWSNRDEILEKNRARYHENPAPKKEANAAWYSENRVRLKSMRADWARKNRDRMNERDRRRRSREKQATPAWLTDDQVLEMERLYEMARFLTNITGIKREVDHIIPIQGKNVCGLHVPWNLQVLTAEENRKKHNKLNQGVTNDKK
jgi:5-methylcytosine-specific restriction endonuclease McrA